MAEPDKQQIGDGGDPIQAARQIGNAARQTAETAGASASGVASSTAAATANTAAAAVSVGAQTGGAVAEIAVGTAAGGPWGAIIAAAWAMRHTLFKILICICLFLMFIISAVVSLPSIVFNQVFHTDPDSIAADAGTDMVGIYDDLALAVSKCVSGGYEQALSEVERIISEGDYDYDASIEALINYGHASEDYDIAYVLAAYSASMEQHGTTKADMTRKLDAVAEDMFRVTYTEKETEKTVEVVTVLPDGTETKTTETKTVKYAECTIHPFDQSVILKAFNIDTSAKYGQFSITYGEAIQGMASALKRTLYGSLGSGDVPPLTDAELQAFLNQLTCSAKRKELIRVCQRQ